MIPVILSGGSGTRLWPVSRASYPKQFCELYDRSFLSNTIHRLKDLGEIYILTTRSMEALTQRAVKQEGLNADNVIFEPMGKNTAPAVALLCHILDLRGLRDEVVGVFPSDHMVSAEAEFIKAVRLAESMALKGYVTTLGVQPHFAGTGYGYIEVSSTKLGDAGDLKAFAVEGFREKPNQATAEEYLRTGRHFWNAGMFVFRVSDMIALFEKLTPVLWEKISAIKADMENAKYNYALVENISLDYAVMEKLNKQACVPCDMGWSDVGSWDEVARITEESTEIHSQSQALVFNQNSENNYVFSINRKVIGLIDVTDLIVVDTPDGLLVAHKGSSQKVRQLVDAMREAAQPQATEHPFESRPWGGYEVLLDEPNYKVKRITVDPGAQLSYQSHKKREEHWVVVSGQAQVVLNEKIHELGPGESIYIPTESKHRMRNPGVAPLVFIETQTGSYFGEDDIVRYQDDYNRLNT